jgi:plastocyanin
MAATMRMRRKPWAAAAMALLVASGAHAGVIRGTLEVPATSASLDLHPYPGRAGSMPAAGSAPGAVTDAILYVAKVPSRVTVPAPEEDHPDLAQRQQAFVPRVLAIQVGTTVDFPNFDPIFHNVFSVSPTKRFDLGKYARGHSRSVRFLKPGLVNVYCDIHSDMAAYIYVLPHHVFTRPSAAGRFTLPALPPGSYTLVAWHPDFGEIRRDVQVPAQGDAVVELHF